MKSCRMAAFSMKGKCMAELLAPAGDKECFVAAIMAGADAVYVGGNKYGARAYARNFEQEDLIDCLHLAHLFGKKVYLTINTLMKQQELSELVSFLTPYYEEGLDGVIIQDFGALSVVKENFPGLELHASTQMTITGFYGAQLLKDYGVSRVVPARELSLAEIMQIKEKTGLEMETFIHGAMCYGYSGQCLFSSMLGQRSGNRGRCAGPCRLPYGVEYEGKRLNKNNEAYQLSLKDLCVLEILPQLLDAGIDSFKIEGRMKTPEYVSFVTGMYRKYIDLYEKGSDAYHVSKEDMNLLRNRFSRGSIQSGYYFMHNGRELVTLDKPGYQSFEKDDMENNLSDTQHIYKIDLDGHFTAIKGKEVCLTVWKKNHPESAAIVTGAVTGMAQKCAASQEDVEKQLRKTGNTCFLFHEITFEMDSDLFLPNKELNQLRRDALAKLEKNLLSPYVRSVQKNGTGFESVREKSADETEHKHCPKLDAALKNVERYMQVKLRTGKQFCSFDTFPELKRLYLSTDSFTGSTGKNSLKQDIDKMLQKRCLLKEEGIEFYLQFPHVSRQKTMKILESARNIIEDLSPDGFLVGNLESLAYIKETYPEKKMVTDAGMYLFNAETADFYNTCGIHEHILSYELHRKEIEELCDGYSESCYLPVYGYIPVMESAGCLLKTNHKCRHGEGEEAVVLTDRQNKKRIVITHCDRCENTIYNSVPLSLHKETEQILDMNLLGIIFKFTTESNDEIQKIIGFYRQIYQLAKCSDKSALKAALAASPIYEFTKGHFAKGVE